MTWQIYKLQLCRQHIFFLTFNAQFRIMRIKYQEHQLHIGQWPSLTSLTVSLCATLSLVNSGSYGSTFISHGFANLTSKVPLFSLNSLQPNVLYLRAYRNWENKKFSKLDLFVQFREKYRDKWQILWCQQIFNVVRTL